MVNINHQRNKKPILETYKNKPCYSLLLKCPLCDAQYIKATEHKHLISKKHILNKESYEEAKLCINENNIDDENEQIKYTAKLNK